jgi:hypothetical protein
MPHGPVNTNSRVTGHYSTVFEIPVTQQFDRPVGDGQLSLVTLLYWNVVPEFRVISLLETLGSPTEGEFTPTESGMNTYFLINTAKLTYTHT